MFRVSSYYIGGIFCIIPLYGNHDETPLAVFLKQVFIGDFYSRIKTLSLWVALLGKSNNSRWWDVGTGSVDRLIRGGETRDPVLWLD